MDYALAVGYWAVAQAVSSRYGFDSKTESHFRVVGSRDACRLDPESVHNVDFSVGQGGYCDTCSYEFAEVTFYASCLCGKVKNKSFSVDLQNKGMPELLEEIMTAQPYMISLIP